MTTDNFFRILTGIMLQRMGSLVNQGAETKPCWLLSGGPGTGLRKDCLKSLDHSKHIIFLPMFSGSVHQAIGQNISLYMTLPLPTFA